MCQVDQSLKHSVSSGKGISCRPPAWNLRPQITRNTTHGKDQAQQNSSGNPHCLCIHFSCIRIILRIKHLDTLIIATLVCTREFVSRIRWPPALVLLSNRKCGCCKTSSIIITVILIFIENRFNGLIHVHVVISSANVKVTHIDELRRRNKVKVNFLTSAYSRGIGGKTQQYGRVGIFLAA